MRLQARSLLRDVISLSAAISACMKDVQWQRSALMLNEVSKVGSTWSAVPSFTLVQSEGSSVGHQ
eukprot:9029036-Karenia_brevis.AAC.1